MSKSIRLALLCLTCLFPALSRAAEPLVHAKPAPDFEPSAAYRWLEISLEATAREVDRVGARPTIISRTLAVGDDGDVRRLGGVRRRRRSARGSAARCAVRRASAPTANKREGHRLCDVSRIDRRLSRRQGVARGADARRRLRSERRDDGSDERRRASATSPRRPSAITAITTARISSAMRSARTARPYSDYTFYAPVNAPGKDRRSRSLAAAPLRPTRKGAPSIPGFSRRTGIASNRSPSIAPINSARRRRRRSARTS